MIQVREAPTGSSVRVSCSAKSFSAAATPEVRVIGPARRVLAEADAAHQRRIADMGRYDQPVPASAIRSSFYNNDAPPLQWPSWLVQEGSNAPIKPVAGRADGKQHLECRYKTTLPISRTVSALGPRSLER